MPYKMFKQNGKWCVKNEDTGENKGCSDNRAKATGHLRALYAAEGGAKMGKKEINELFVKAVEDYNAENPDDAISMIELLGLIEAQPDDEVDLEDQIIDEEEEDEEEKAKRADVSAADKKRAVAEYGDVKYADPENKKYPVDSEKHIRAAWSYINMPRNAKKYDSKKLAAIKGKIVSAWKSKIDKAGPPSSSSAKEIFGRIEIAVKEVLGLMHEDDEWVTAEVKAEEKEMPDNDLMVYKDTDTGLYRWFGRYSNNFRDNDRPPEIISSTSHKTFVERVEKGMYPMPELWLWHVKDWKIGQADWLAYDDSGFALASGTFEKGLDDVAEWLMGVNDVSMSHGMPPSTIVRDKDDPSIIIEHQTKEISVLPRFAAANKITGFAVLGKEESMAIPKEKKQVLLEKWNADPALLERLEAMNALVADQAKEAGLESKETEQPVQEEVAQVETETAKTEEVKAETTPTVDYPTRQEIIEAVAAVLTPLADRLDTLESSLNGVLGEVKELKSSREEQVKQVIESTPAASLGALIAQRVIGSKDAVVDGRTKLADSKPKETPVASEHAIGIPFLDEMLSSKTT